MKKNVINKPAKICVLEKDKIIDVQEGFVDTFNWIVSVIDALSKSDINVVSKAEYSKKKHKLTAKSISLEDLIAGKTKLSDKTVFDATPISET